MPTVRDVRRYWEANPLMSFEIPAPPGTREFFLEHERIRWSEVERFAKHFWRFPDLAGKRLLDVGCGPGFLSRLFAKQGARVIYMDLTTQGVRLARRSLELFELPGRAVQANAERLPFEEASLDFVVSSGVLHHTPDTEGAVAEVHRVLRPGGQALITLYYRNVLLRPPLWALTRRFLKYAITRVPGREAMATPPRSVEEFTRIYDGDANPVGKAYTRAECAGLFTKFAVRDVEVHFFPKRFLVGGRWMPPAIHRLFDRVFGTMIYYRLEKVL